MVISRVTACLGLALPLIFACRTTVAPSATATAEPEPSEPTTATAEPEPSEPTTDPTAAHDDPPPPSDPLVGAPANLGVNDIAGHPARWNGETVVLTARLGYETVSCTRSVPPSCQGQWILLDADAAKSMRLVLLDQGVPVPAVCRPASSSLVSASPCLPGELDPEQRYRLEGEGRYDHGQMQFLATRIVALTPTDLTPTD